MFFVISLYIFEKQTLRIWKICICSRLPDPWVALFTIVTCCSHNITILCIYIIKKRNNKKEDIYNQPAIELCRDRSDKTRVRKMSHFHTIPYNNYNWNFLFSFCIVLLNEELICSVTMTSRMVWASATVRDPRYPSIRKKCTPDRSYLHLLALDLAQTRRLFHFVFVLLLLFSMICFDRSARTECRRNFEIKTKHNYLVLNRTKNMARNQKTNKRNKQTKKYLCRKIRACRLAHERRVAALRSKNIVFCWSRGRPRKARWYTWRRRQSICRWDSWPWRRRAPSRPAPLWSPPARARTSTASRWMWWRRTWPRCSVRSPCWASWACASAPRRSSPWTRCLCLCPGSRRRAWRAARPRTWRPA